jgi:protein-S-isoprenylcysteine O-methyltransferase Ste14
MIREFVGAELVPPEKHFRWRRGEITRLEGFTDAVFVLAVTLLIVSSEVAKTFSQLAVTMKGFLAFTVCFGLLAHIWHYHYISRGITAGLLPPRFSLLATFLLKLEGRLRFDRTTYLSQTREIGSGRSASGFGRVRHDLIAAFVW